MRLFKVFFLSIVFIGFISCKGQKTTGGHEVETDTIAAALSMVTPKYATGWQVRDSADVRLVTVGAHDRFALVRTGTYDLYDDASALQFHDSGCP